MIQVLHCFYFDLFFSFLLTHKKLVQNELKSHGYLHIINSGKKTNNNNNDRTIFSSHLKDQRHIPVITDEPLSRQLIKLYKLWKSQLIFSLTDYVGNNVFNIFPGSSVSSQVMFDEINQQRGMCIKQLCAYLIDIFCFHFQM
jgi:hypothetical protein